MSRPEVSVVMPFAGDATAAWAAIESLRTLVVRPGDELILVDNAGTVPAAAGIRVIPAPGERSPAHARNVGAAHAARDWILFLDADTHPRPDLLDAYFAEPIADEVGALAGEVAAASGPETLAARYGSARSFLGLQAHLEHPFMPRAAAANLLVRAAAFARVGGFYEGVRAAEDTDFSWRLQRAGWRLEPRETASVAHSYRPSIVELRRQWRGYAAGRAWLARRYDGFEPQPALARALRRASARTRRRHSRTVAPSGRAGRHYPSASPSAPRDRAAAPRRAAPPVATGRLERARYLALDALLSVDELAGFTLSNRPADRRPPATVDVVLIADRFPARGDPLAELAGTLDRVRVEAVARPEAPDVELARRLEIDYLEDDGVVGRIAATLMLVLRHPLRSALDVVGRDPGAPPLRALAPAVRRLERDPGARMQPLGAGQIQEIARRLASLAGRALDR